MRYFKDKRKAPQDKRKTPSYSRALRRIKWVAITSADCYKMSAVRLNPVPRETKNGRAAVTTGFVEKSLEGRRSDGLG